ncbi:MAG TPA: GNAT family N-acetyltransferase [Pyrinomonadaceae bacterium]|nr:GNAT family N-acetyltransferase [Pyrinomonadaceae bacterium]
MNFQIQIAEVKDVSLIVEMIREFAEFEKLSEFCEVTEENLHEAMFGENSFLEGLIAFDADKAIGYALFYQNFASFRGQRGFYLEDLYVKQEYRGRGTGEAFLRKLAQIAKSRNFKRIDFMVLNWNKTAIKFYKKLGATMDDEERHSKFTDAAFARLCK